MHRSLQQQAAWARGEVVDFDPVLLKACPPKELAEVMSEAELLAQAFAPNGRAAEIEKLAAELQSGARALDRGRQHAVRLAAALRQLAKAAAA